MCNGAAKQVSAGIKCRNLFGNVETGLKMNHGRLVPVSEAYRDKTERDQFHEVVLHGETLVFITTATVAEVESGSTFRETCLATEVQKSFTKPTMLHGAMFRSVVALACTSPSPRLPPNLLPLFTIFPVFLFAPSSTREPVHRLPLHTSFSKKFQRVTAV